MKIVTAVRGIIDFCMFRTAQHRSVMLRLIERRRRWQLAVCFASCLLVPAGFKMAVAAERPVVDVPDAAAQAAAEMKPYTDIITGADVKFQMVPIPAGKFVMGSPASEPGRKDDEGPQHDVTVDAFWMGRCEVTWDEYEPFMTAMDIEKRKASGATPTENDKLADALARPTKPYTDMTFGMGKHGYPAISMTHFAARKYCQWLSAKTGRYYRLPTEAEWEHACRAGTKTAYSFGDDATKLGDYAWFFDNSDSASQKVGRKKPNPWGLYDMHGNVAEWVLDQYIADFYKQSGDKAVSNPLAPTKTMYPHPVRGGSWDDDAAALRSAARRASSKEWKDQDPQLPQSVWYFTDAQFVGFRIVRPLREPTDEEKKKIWDVGLDAEGEGGRFVFPSENPAEK
jgi:formylglycine-generating enzyme required for sulfatase activity